MYNFSVAKLLLNKSCLTSNLHGGIFKTDEMQLQMANMATGLTLCSGAAAGCRKRIKVG